MVMMPTYTSAPLKSKDPTFPPIPRRGRVKAQIFESLAKTVVSVASMAGGSRKRNRGDAGDTGSSPTETPPPSSSISESDTDFLGDIRSV